MAATFHLSVLTPERSVFEGDVEYVEVPGAEGYLGVLAHHAPLITALKEGRLEMRDPSGRVTAYRVGGGFLEVSNSVASVLADSAEPLS